MYWHTASHLRGPLSRDRASWKGAPEPFRPDLVARVRREIAEGRYDTPDKWYAALERLLNHLDWA